MRFMELDDETRKWMLVEFEVEWNNKPFIPSSLSIRQMKFEDIMRETIQTGNIQRLEADIRGYVKSTERRTRNGRTYEVKTPSNAAHRLAHSEFNTWYTRGLARRLIEEGVKMCQIYRGELAENPRCSCQPLEGKVVNVKAIYDGHRPYHYSIQKTSNYDGNPISIPNGPLCHHTIKRVV